MRTNREKAYFFASIQGDEDLRRNLVKFVSRKGIKADSSNIQVFSDNNQALHFILSMFLHPGDSVIVDELSSPDVPRSVELAVEHLASGKLYERLEEFRAIYREKRNLMCARLDVLAERYPLRYVKPGGGVYIWVELPLRVSAKSLLAKARRRGVTFMTGKSFFEEPSRGRSHIRLNYSYPLLDEIGRGMDALGLALGEALEG